MIRSLWFVICALTGAALLAACGAVQPSPTPAVNIANPASVFCEENGGKLELRQDASGGVAGVCVFPDGSECDEWAYFRGECKQGDSLAAAGPSPAPGGETAADGCKIFLDESLGYSFHYPADAKIITNDDPLRSISVTGPLTAGGDQWPQITLSHPADREEYRPPEGSDLEKWLVDHNLMPADSSRQTTGEIRQPDMQIAGTTAVHTRHERSPQSYAYDRYYFTTAGQLYMLVIGHTADHEDWTLYNHILESFRFKP